ncbi:hypothetical protein V8F06_003450 [Rhypophila decipiens]
MADPLSLSASLAGLITLADAIFRASFKYAKSATNAKEEAANLATEAQDLAGVLHPSALELEAPDWPTIRLHHVISCRQLLLRVEGALAKSTADFESPQARHRLKRALHRGTLSLALTVDSMDALSQCLTNQETLQAQMATIASGVQETHEITAHIEMNDRKRRVLDYFRPVDPQRSLGQCLGLRHPMTGLWLVDGEDFQEWLAVPHSKLWLTGIPGAGKTVLAGAMIAEVLKLSSDSTGIAFFFCEYKDQRSQDPLSILQTMAPQLALQNQAAYSLLEEYHKALQPLQGLGSSMSLWRMKEILGQMVSCFKKVYMIIDGLDECGDNAAEVAGTLTSLMDDDDSAISLSILSRDEYQIREVLQDRFERVEISAHREDVRLYVATEITSRIQQGRLRLRNMALKDEILHALVVENGGMFRWVACQLDYLCELPRDRDRRQTLKSLPPTLNETYEQILERVEKRDHRVRSLVQRCLEFITAADPPLLISELCEAVSMEADTEDLEEEDMIDKASILKHCSSLIRVRDTHSGDFEIVEFSHFSVAEYLQGPSLPGSNLEKYHMDRSKGQENLMSWRPDSAPNAKHPIYPYASIFWLTYWDQRDDDETVLLVMNLFNRQKTTAFIAWALQIYYFLLIPSYYRSSFRDAMTCFKRISSDDFENCRNIILEKNFTTLHMAAALGLSSVCSRLLNKGANANVNAMCTLGTPLHCVLSPFWLLPPDGRGNHDADDIERISSDGDYYFESGGLPLFAAAVATCYRIRGLDIIVMLLKAGLTIQPGDLEEFRRMASLPWTPLKNDSDSEAHIRNHGATILAAIKDLSPFSNAAAELYPYAFDIPPRSLSWPKHTATSNPTADPALLAIFAAQSDDPEELQRLFGAGNLDIKGRLNRIAAENGPTKAVLFLLRHDFEGWLPLWHCVSDTHAGVLAALLESDPSQGSCKDPQGNTIWHLLLQMLIEKSTDLRKDLTLLNYAGDCPLALALMGEKLDLAMLMIDSCPAVVQLWSAKNGSMEVAQKLVGTGFIDTTATTADIRATSLFPDLEAIDINGARPLEAFVVNTIYEISIMVQTAKINQVLDEIIPPHSSSTSSTRATFWQKFCFGATLTSGWPRNPTSLDVVVPRLVNIAERKTSALYPFISAIDGIPYKSGFPMRGTLVNSLTTLLGVTNYWEEARNSNALAKCLHKAIKENIAKTVQTLLDRGVDPHIRIDGYNALDTACAHWSKAELDIFDMVIGRVDQSTINSFAIVSTAKKRLGPIHLVGEPKPSRILQGVERTLKRQMLARLIDAGADPNLCTGANVPALVFYLKRRNIDLSLYALELGADPGRVDENGYDAITHAVLRGYVQFISHLRDLERQGRLGHTVQWSRRADIVWDNKWRGRGRVIPLGEAESVHAWGRQRSDPVFKDCNALHLVALQGHRGVLEFYLGEGLIDDIDAKSGNGWTPLHFASYRGSSSMIRCLHGWGADMNPNKGQGVSASRIVGADCKTAVGKWCPYQHKRR